VYVAWNSWEKCTPTNTRADHTTMRWIAASSGCGQTTAALALEPVSDTVHGLDVRGLAGNLFDLLAQPANVDVERLRVSEEVLAPDVV
jgi:hypothetical protein